MSNDPSVPILGYMNDLRSCLMYGRCAGKITRLSKLHQNRLTSRKGRIEAVDQLRKVSEALDQLNVLPVSKAKNEIDRELYDLFQIDEKTSKLIQRILKFFESKEGIVWGDNIDSYLDDVPEQEIILSHNTVKQEKTLTKICGKFIDVIGAEISPSSLNLIQENYARIRKELISKYDPELWPGGFKTHSYSKWNKKKIAHPALDSYFNKKNRTSFIKYTRLMAEMEKELRVKIYEFNNIKNMYSEISLYSGDGRYSVKGIKELRIEIRDLQSKLNALMSLSSNHSTEEDFYQKLMRKFRYFYYIKRAFSNVESFHEKFLYGTVDINEYIDQLTTRKNKLVYENLGGLISIFGDPGFGKTIQLRQFAHKFTMDQIKDSTLHKIPIYVKAKTVSKYIRNYASERYGFAIDQSNGETIQHSGRATRHDGELNEICMKSMLETEPELEKASVEALFGIQRSVAKNMVFIIDAYDEVPTQDARFELVSFLSDQIEKHHWPVIMTCREKSHKEELKEAYYQFNNDMNPHIDLNIHFTANELQYIMPTKLANAWGMNSDQISHSVATEYDHFKKVLTHPLFVGLYCMLKSKGVDLDVLDFEFESADGISVHHIAFLKQVIDFGLNINIGDRKSITDKTLQKIRKAFCYLASIHLTMGLTKLQDIFVIMEKLHSFTLTEDERVILSENLGIMFVNGENEIEWTHKTLPEVAMGLLISEDDDFLEFLRDTHGDLFGWNDEFWTECLFLTLIDDELMLINDSLESVEMVLKKETMPILKHLFDSMESRTIKKSLSLLGIRDQIFKDVNVNIQGVDHSGGEPSINVQDWSFKALGNTLFERELRRRIGNTYFHGLLSNQSFPMPVVLFGDELENKNKNELLDCFFQIGAQTAGINTMITEPQNLDWPTYYSEDLSHLRGNYSMTKLVNVYLNRAVSDRKPIVKSAVRRFVMNLRVDWIDWVDQLPHNPWISNKTDSEWVELILCCAKSNYDLSLLESMIMGSNEQASNDLIHTDKKACDEIGKLLFKNIDRGSSAPGKISLEWMRAKHPFVAQKLLSVIASLSLNGRVNNVKVHFIWKDFICQLKNIWGIPEDFTTQISEDSSMFDKIVSLNLEKTPDSLLKMIISRNAIDNFVSKVR